MECSVNTSFADFNTWSTKINRNLFSLDTETTSLNYYDLKLIGFSICDGKLASYTDLDVMSGTDRQRTIIKLKEILEEENDFLIFHNAPYDLKVLHKVGIQTTTNIFCTMTAAHLIDEEQSVALKPLAVMYLGAETMTYKQAIKFGVNHPRFYEYANNDAVWAWELHKIFNKDLHQMKMERLFYEIEMPFQFVLMDLAIVGVRFDLKKNEELRVDLVEKRKQALIDLYKICGLGYHVQPDLFGDYEVVSAHNLNSDTQLVKVLEKKLGVVLTDVTPGGAKSVAKGALNKVKDQHVVIPKIIRYNIMEGALSKYILPAPSWVNGDGRVRGGFNNCVARTGRLSSSEPNLQNLSNPQEEFPVDFRQCFIATEGKTMVGADYGGQELRVLAHVCGEQKLIEAFLRNKDIHLMTANFVLGLGIADEVLYEAHPEYADTKEKFKAERKKIKNAVVFPIIYGTTAVGIAKSLGIEEKLAQSYIDGFMELYPAVAKKIRQTGWKLKKVGYVSTLSYRRRNLDAKFKKSYRQAFNFLIQGLSADMVRLAMVKLRKMYQENPHWGAVMLITVHDEILSECNNEYVEEVKVAISDAMKSAMKLCIPLEVELSVGKNYSACH